MIFEDDFHNQDQKAIASYTIYHIAQNIGDRKLWWIVTQGRKTLVNWLLCSANQLG